MTSTPATPKPDMTPYIAMQLTGFPRPGQTYLGALPPVRAIKEAGEPVFFVENDPSNSSTSIMVTFSKQVSTYTIESKLLTRDHFITIPRNSLEPIPLLRRGQEFAILLPVTIENCHVKFDPGYVCKILTRSSNHPNKAQYTAEFKVVAPTSRTVWYNKKVDVVA